MSRESGNRPGEGAAHSVGTSDATENTRQPHTTQADRLARVHDRELIDLIQQLGEVDDALVGSSVEAFTRLVAHDVIARTIDYLGDLRDRSGGAVS